MHSAYIEECPSNWSPTTIGEVCEIVGGGTPDRSIKAYWGGSIAWATPTDITSLDDIEIASTKETITEAGLENSAARILPPSSILMTSRATIGYCAINKIPITTNQGFASVICGPKVHNFYLLYWLTFMKPKIERLASGSTFKEISRSSLRSLTIHLPPIREQKRIAEILRVSESAIQRTKQSFNVTKHLKHGLMQRLLTRGIGHTRFKQTEIGEIPESWEIGKLIDYCSLITDGSHYSPPHVGDGYPLATVANIRDSEIDIESCYRIGEEDYNLLVRNTCKPEYNDVLFSKDGTLGLSLVWRNSTDLVLLSSIAILRPKAHCLDSHYLSQTLRAPQTLKRILNMTSGTAIKRIVLRDLRKVSIPIPSIGEQKRIANLLNQVDQEIAVEKHISASLVQMKKGLMQVLLTGKVRVKT